MHVLDERSPLRGYDAARAIEADVRVFLTFEGRDPTLATLVHAIRTYAPEDIRFGMRYTDALTIAEDAYRWMDLTRIGELELDIGDCQEPGWTEGEERQ
jgi:inward rectifier potassium channel